MPQTDNPIYRTQILPQNNLDNQLNKIYTEGHELDKIAHIWQTGNYEYNFMCVFKLRNIEAEDHTTTPRSG